MNSMIEFNGQRIFKDSLRLEYMIGGFYVVIGSSDQEGLNNFKLACFLHASAAEKFILALKTRKEII